MSGAEQGILQRILPELPGWAKVLTSHQATGCHASLRLAPAELPGAVERLVREGFFLEDVSAVDLAEGVMVVYHFDLFAPCQRLALRVVVSHADPRLPSLVPLVTGADWHERECHDFFGVVFVGHPDLKPLLLPDDCQSPPLRKTGQRQPSFAIWPPSLLMGADQGG